MSPQKTAVEAPMAPSKTVAITGGTGMLGSLIGRWLLQHRENHVVLLGRRGTGSAGNLGSACGAVSICSCGVSSVDDVNALLYHGDAKSQPPLAGLMHAGGALADASLQNQTAPAMRLAFAPKASGARNCLSALEGRATSLSVFFSSTASLFGSPGQASYAAANSFLDSLSASQRAQGKCGVAIQWGAWAGGGMAMQDASTVRRLERNGFGLIQPLGGISALESLLGGSLAHSVAAVTSIRWPTFSARFSSRFLTLAAGDTKAPASGLQRQSEEDIAGPGSTTQEQGSGISDLASMLLSQSRDSVQQMVQSLVAEDVQGVLGRALPLESNLFEGETLMLGACG